MKNIAIIGSTGSIGKTALKVIKKLGYNVVAIVGYKNLELLSVQSKEFSPSYVGVIDEKLKEQAQCLFGKKLVLGKEALTFACSLAEVDTVLISVTGISGAFACMEAIKHGKRIALANNESLVAAGELIITSLSKSNAEIIPVDSEHSAVFQCLLSSDKKQLERIILTASGGGFYGCTKNELERIQPKDIFHPNWNMGRKITIDSCTMMNKALEIIEAAYLFDTKRIDYIVHPESIIHSMVEFKDGAVLAQLAISDMSLPIQYALCYPQRVQCLPSFAFDRPLTFLPKNELFFAPQLSFYCLEQGGDSGAIMNAANEAAVELFEQGKIGFSHIVEITKKVLFEAKINKLSSLDDVIAVHNQTKQKVLEIYKTVLE
jgi:1-deoxy-D-xylulose-5-phosphate reductoisomerase